MFGKLISAFLLILLSAALAFSQAKSVDRVEWQKDYSLALKIAQKTGKPVLIDFNAEWCPPCRTLEKFFWSRPEIVELSKEFVCISVDYDRDTLTVARFGVKSIPHIVLADPWGNMLAFHHGYAKGGTENAIRSAMKTVRKDFSEILEPNFKLETDKDNAAALIKIGEFYRKINFLFISNAYFKRALKSRQLKPGDALRENLLTATGNNYLQMRDYDEAEKYFNDSLREFPDGASGETALFGLIMINIRRQKLADAETIFGQMKTRFPNSETTQQAAQNLQEARTQSN